MQGSLRLIGFIRHRFFSPTNCPQPPPPHPQMTFVDNFEHKSLRNKWVWAKNQTSRNGSRFVWHRQLPKKVCQNLHRNLKKIRRAKNGLKENYFSHALLVMIFLFLIHLFIFFEKIYYCKFRFKILDFLTPRESKDVKKLSQHICEACGQPLPDRKTP